ncbi:MAG: aminotransferase CobD/cobyrinic acid synthase [Spirochaetes bacterium]|nr:MAG: aminotransferase CobD/cobyrinic acid synthase [Spirochaetota bacterium]
MNIPQETQLPTRDHLRHGGNLQEISNRTGIDPYQILDYSANINPAGPPPWIKEALMAAASRVRHYPDPDSTVLREAASQKFGLSPESFLFADGADSLLFALPLALGAKRCLIPVPSYSGYFRAARRAGIPAVSIRLPAEKNFSLASPEFSAALEEALDAASPATQGVSSDTMVFLGAPNNPAGGSLPHNALREIAGKNPGACFVVDESFIELSAGIPSLLDFKNSTPNASLPPNLIVARSLTKAWAIPGARAGFIAGNPDIIQRVRSQLPAWPLSCFAEEIALRCLGDNSYLPSTVPYLLKEADAFAASIAALGDIKVIRSSANFLLLDFISDSRAEAVHGFLLSRGIAIRTYSPEEGLSPRYARIAVRSDRENARFLSALRDAISATP